MKNNFLNISDLTKEDFELIFHYADEIKPYQENCLKIKI